MIPAPRKFLIGQNISHYEFLEKLGEGGMGVVYKARDTKLDRIVAVKLLHPHLMDSEEQVARFHREARAVSALNHRHIATIYDFDKAKSQSFLVLEYLPNGTLHSKVKSGELLGLDRILLYAIQIAEGLAHAHRRGIVHRDVKSSNVMFTADGELKLTDFGLAKDIRGQRDNHPTRSGSILGTAAYMSPEQAQGRDVDVRSDIFSLGIVMHELCTGALPFHALNDLALLQEIIRTPTPSFRAFRADLPEELDRIVAKMLEKDPARRYQQMDEALADLRRLRTGTLTAVTMDDPPAAPVSTRRRRTRAPVAALLAALAIVASVIGVMWSRRQGAMPAEKHIALLPFANVNGDAASRTFSEGLVETLTSGLTQLEQFQGSLRVVPASEVRIANVKSAGEARARFGVTLVLTGSVQRTSDQLRVTGNLVDATSLRQLRTFTKAVRVEDAASLQDGLVRDVAELLELELRPQARGLMAAGGTQAPAAYELYIQGRGRLQRYDRATDVDAALGLFQQATERDPNYALAFAGWGEAYWRKYGITKEARWVDLAREKCRRALRLSDRLAPVYVTLGMVSRGTGQYEDAIRDFQRALQLDPVNADALREMASTYASTGKHAEAEATYKKAIDQRPNYWAGYGELSVFYFRRGRYAEAGALGEKIVQMTPDNPKAHANLGAFYSRMGRFPEAARMLERAVEIQPSSEVYSNLGTVYYWQERYADAVRMYEKAVGARPSYMTWGNLADAYKREPILAGKAPAAYRQAIAMAGEELKINPRSGPVRANVAVFWAKLGEKRKAINEIGQARRNAPSDLGVEYRSALAYEICGERDRALAALERAIQGGYSFEEISRASHLAELRKDPRYQRLAALRKP